MRHLLEILGSNHESKSFHMDKYHCIRDNSDGIQYIIIPCFRSYGETHF